MLAISNDDRTRAKWMADELGRAFPVLSDMSMRVIARYGMQGAGMQMAEMGYVVIDRSGRIRVRRIDRAFGDHSEQILAALKAPGPSRRE